MLVNDFLRSPRETRGEAPTLKFPWIALKRVWKYTFYRGNKVINIVENDCLKSWCCCFLIRPKNQFLGSINTHFSNLWIEVTWGLLILCFLPFRFYSLYNTPGYFVDRLNTHTSIGEVNVGITIGRKCPLKSRKRF